MATKYQSFKDLPLEVAERLKRLIIAGEEAYHRSGFTDPSYTEEELSEITKAFSLFNNAAKKGLPNQLYEMLARILSDGLVTKSYKLKMIWHAHGDPESVQELVQAVADEIKSEIDKRENWDEEQFHEEYLLDWM